jgi:hypothetical protein
MRMIDIEWLQNMGMENRKGKTRNGQNRER